MKQGSIVRTIAVFALVGPAVPSLPLAGLFALAAIGGAFAPHEALVAIAQGYAYGFIPALFTGVVAAAVSPKIDGKGRWIGLAMLVGVPVSALAGIPAALPMPSLQALLAVCGMMGLFGAIASSACALLTAKFRPRVVDARGIELEFA